MKFDFLSFQTSKWKLQQDIFINDRTLHQKKYLIHIDSVDKIILIGKKLRIKKIKK